MVIFGIELTVTIACGKFSLGQTLPFAKIYFSILQLLEKALYHVPLREADSIVTLNKTPVDFFQRAIRNLKGDEEFWRDKDHLFDFNGDAEKGSAPLFI